MCLFSASDIRNKLKVEVQELKAKYPGFTAGLAIVQVTSLFIFFFLFLKTNAKSTLYSVFNFFLFPENFFDLLTYLIDENDEKIHT